MVTQGSASLNHVDLLLSGLHINLAPASIQSNMDPVFARFETYVTEIEKQVGERLEGFLYRLDVESVIILMNGLGRPEQVLSNHSEFDNS